MLSIGLIWLSIAMLSSCNLFKKADYSDQTPIEVVSDDEMMTEANAEEFMEEDEVKPTDKPDIFLTYERSYCFGMCPVFKSEIMHDGTVNYEGINFVDNMGNHSAVISTSDLDLIKVKLEEINYFDLDSIYNNLNVMDMPSVTTSVYWDGNAQKVFDRFEAPKELRTLYSLLDEIYGRLEWNAIISNE